MNQENPEVLKLENVSKVYGVGTVEVRAVDSTDLIVNRGEILLIMGPSGSGKTTLKPWQVCSCAQVLDRFLSKGKM